ncbi:MAG TPA: TRAP transporter substrate-binding protein DctP [Magnetococcales bacterium]|nr:TRAP transporter substrate-binding protein DctP [Magnetococcales bacterium]
MSLSLRLLIFVCLFVLAPVLAYGQKNFDNSDTEARAVNLMKVTAVQGEGMVYVRLLQQLKQNIETKTQGQIQVDLLIDGAGGSETEALKDQIRGRVQGGWISAMTLAQSLKAFRALTLPLVFNDADQLNQFVGSPLDKSIRATSATKKLTILGYGSFGFYGIMLFEAMPTPGDPTEKDALDLMKSRTVRVPEDEWIETVQTLLPGKVVRVPGVDLKKAIDSGWVNGFLITPEFIANKEWMAQASHFLNLRHLHGWSVFSVNRDWLESLPNQHREVVQLEVQAMCQQALQGGLARHDALVDQWYKMQRPQVVQASWDRMAVSVHSLNNQTIHLLGGILGATSRVRTLWEANYRVDPSVGALSVGRNAASALTIQKTRGGEMASVMVSNHGNNGLGQP